MWLRAFANKLPELALSMCREIRLWIRGVADAANNFRERENYWGSKRSSPFLFPV